MTNATLITLQRTSNFNARICASQFSKLPTQVAATRRPRDRKENSESVRSLALDLRVCRARRAHVTSSRDVVSAGPIHPRRRLLRTRLLQTCPKSNATALRSTKAQAYHPKCIYRVSKHPKHPQRAYRLQAYYHVHLHTKLIAGPIPPLRKSKSPTC